MTKKTYWRMLAKSVSTSKGRFLSILSLMALGSFAFVGLRVTVPDMNRAGNAFLDAHQTQDLLVSSPLGLTDQDQEKLAAIKGATVEFGQSTDVSLDDQALRIYSQPKSISTFSLLEGKMPTQAGQIALDDSRKAANPIGSQVSIQQGKNGRLADTKYTVVGYIASADILSKENMGTSSAASGQLKSYGLVPDSAFKDSKASFARIKYKNTEGLDAFGPAYKQVMKAHEDDLDKLTEELTEARQESLRKEGQAAIADAKSKMESAESDLAAGTKQLDAARAFLPADQVASKQADLDKAAADLAKKKQEVADKEADLKDLRIPAYTWDSRTTHSGAQGYQIFSNSLESISAVANIFPVVLYLVAAMLTLTTMTRFVDEERIQSGTLRALGYDKRDVVRKFVLYGLLASGLGTLLGILGGHYFLSPMISSIITQDSVIGQVPTHFSWLDSLLAFALSFAAAVIPAYWVAQKELQEMPAHLLLPKPPVSGSRILLERLTFIWKKMTFTQKVTARNIFRYKERMLMTIFGVAGATALLFAGLGIQSSINGVADRQFGDILNYQLLVAVNDKEDLSDFDQLLLDSRVKASRSIQATSLMVTPNEELEKQAVTLMIGRDQDFRDVILLNNRQGQTLSVSDGVIISEKLAALYGAKVCDSISVDGKDLKIAGITENYAGHFIYMTPEQYKDTYGKSLQGQAYLIQLKDSSKKGVEAAARDFTKLDAVVSVSQNLSLKSSFQRVAKSLLSTMLILVVVSVLLALVILYNLTNINVSERIRELSTIKVLGFYDKEVMLYIYRETIILSLLGLILGLTSGYFLHQILIEKIAGTTILFNPKVSMEVYLIPVAVLISILLGLSYMVYYRLKHVDMLEA